MVDEQGNLDVGDIEREMSVKEQENQYLRGKNLALQDATESGYGGRPDPNVIEYKLSSEELLESIEHYLRGDILKTRTNEQGQVESYYAIPTKKISVTLFKERELGKIYVVDEHPKMQPFEEDWNVLSIFEGNEKDGVVETQIEENYKPIVLKEIKDGMNRVYKKQPRTSFFGYATKEVLDTSRTNLSEYGVQEVMNTLSMYIRKETFLSWYKEDRIMEILSDVGNQLNKFFLVNYKLMGLDTEYKKTKYPVMVVTILHTVENAYRRALLGQENKGTREGIIITQHQSPNMQMPQTMPIPKKKWSAFDKSSW